MAERRPALTKSLAGDPHASRETQLAKFPLLHGRLVELEGGSVTFATANHGLGRRYRGGIVVAMDDAQWCQVVSPDYLDATGLYDPTKVFAVNVGGAGVANTITVWVF